MWVWATPSILKNPQGKKIFKCKATLCLLQYHRQKTTTEPTSGSVLLDGLWTSTREMEQRSSDITWEVHSDMTKRAIKRCSPCNSESLSYFQQHESACAAQMVQCGGLQSLRTNEKGKEIFIRKEETTAQQIRCLFSIKETSNSLANENSLSHFLGRCSYFGFLIEQNETTQPRNIANRNVSSAVGLTAFLHSY